MKVLYWDCPMGAAGDMLAASLLELCPDRSAALGALNALGIPGVEYRAEAAEKCGVRGTHLTVLVHGGEEPASGEGSCCAAAHEHDHDHDHDHEHEHDHEHDHDHDHDHEHAPDGAALPQGHHPHVHRSLADIAAVIGALHAPASVRADALAVYSRIAQAEAQVHGTEPGLVHFHEVGALDAVADVSAVCLLLHLLAPDAVSASPMQVGGGTVRCAHGILPVPAPATALLLTGWPVRAGAAESELCTPTGAALVRQFAAACGPMPALRLLAVGRGCGKKDFPAANCVTAYWGEADDTADGGASAFPAGDDAHPMDSVAELRCNLDDMTPEAVAYAQAALLEAGALDVFTTPIGMKKSRPGVLLTCLCRPAQRAEMAALLLRHTTTLGVRESLCARYTLRRCARAADTPWGPVRIKTAEGWGVRREKAEYEDLARIARETGLPLAEIRKKVLS